MPRGTHIRTVEPWHTTSAYLDRLAEVPAFRHCTRRQLVVASQLVDEIVVAPGTALPASTREIAIAVEPTRVLVVERRALPALLEVVPDLFAPPATQGTPVPPLRLVPTCSVSSA